MRRLFNLLIPLAFLALGACATAGRMDVRATGDATLLAGNQMIDVRVMTGERTEGERILKSRVEQAFRDAGYTVVPLGEGAIHAIVGAGVNMESATPPRDRWVAVVMIMPLSYGRVPLFEGRVVAGDRCGSLADVAPALVDAIFETFPQGGRRAVSVANDPTRCPPGRTPLSP